ncbi:MAG: glucose-1-phosphate adenylyltransferase [Puniceicoccaceae bacterium 5H]|nr:MAG: glucose-1-phosphate adenylyltransferase [Puniceicoccaceae bacterium 5H]
MKTRVICVVMGGGRGTRLHPLTAERCKPAVPLAGKYRLVDIPISNCLNSGLNNIFVLTQFNTASLHRHIQDSYKFDPFGGGFVDILAAEQTIRGDNWYQGTADAVRQNLHHFNMTDDDLVLILSGDQLYQMDFHELIMQHQESGADITIAAKAMRTHEVHGLGLMRVRDDLMIEEFVEKPTDPQVIDSLAVSEAIAANLESQGDEKFVLASMGIYCFKGRVLRQALDNHLTDFGKEIIPHLLEELKLRSYVFQGYWEDIGTVKSFYEANLALTDVVPPFNFFDQEHPVYTHARYLPASKINGATFERSIMAGGSILDQATIKRCVVGVRSVVREGSYLENVVMMGADFFETDEEKRNLEGTDRPKMGVGKNCHITTAIIDKNARIGDNVRMSPEGKPDLFKQGDVMVRDGVLIVPKGGVVPSNTVI